MTNLKSLRPVKSSGSKLILSIDGIKHDLSEYVGYAKFEGFMNNGFVASIRIVNYGFSTIKQFIGLDDDEEKILDRLKKEPIEVKFRIEQEEAIKDGQTPEQHSTGEIVGNLAMVYFRGMGLIEGVEFVIIDKLSWGFRIGDSDGGVKVGNFDELLKQLFDKYAPSVNLITNGTVDYNNRITFYSLREQPYDQLIRLLNIYCKDGQYRIGIKNRTVDIRTNIGGYDSGKVVGYYVHLDNEMLTDITEWNVLLNSSIGHDKTSVITGGISSSTGKMLFPPIGKIEDDKCIVYDRLVPNKYKQGSIQVRTSTSKQDIDGGYIWSPEIYGTSYVESTPEIDLELKYEEYIKSKPTIDYCNNIKKSFNMRLKTHGHGVWNDTIMLGESVIYTDFSNLLVEGVESKKYLLSGYWICYGFTHIYKRNRWITELDLYRLDEDAVGQPIRFT